MHDVLPFSSPPTSRTQYMPLCTWEHTTAATLWPAQTRRRSCYHVEMRSPLWTPWHKLSIGLDHAIPNKPFFLPFKEKQNKTKKSIKSVRENWQKVWTLYTMYKNEGLLLYVIAVLYFVLLRFLWSKMNNIFYERFLIYTLSLTLYLNSHYLCAKWNGNKKIRRKDAIIGAILIFYFCMNCIEKKKHCSMSPVPTVCCLCWLWVGKAKLKVLYIGTYVVLLEFFSKIVWDRFVIAPFVYSTCQMSIPDGNYSVSTYFLLWEQCPWNDCVLPCTESICYGIAYTVGFKM